MTPPDEPLASDRPVGGPSSRPLGDLVARLASEGRLRGTRLDGRAVGSAGLSDISITGVTNDSRDAVADSLFVAIAGEHADGHDHAADAVRAGATALIVERPLPEVAAAQLVVDASRPALASAAAWWYGDPSH